MLSEGEQTQRPERAFWAGGAAGTERVLSGGHHLGEVPEAGVRPEGPVAGNVGPWAGGQVLGLDGLVVPQLCVWTLRSLQQPFVRSYIGSADVYRASVVCVLEVVYLNALLSGCL